MFKTLSREPALIIGMIGALIALGVGPAGTTQKQLEKIIEKQN